MSAARLTDWLERFARETPDAPAAQDNFGNSLTYAQLDALASRVACKLHSMGVRKGDRVGMCVPKCVNSVVTIYGVLKAGAAYVPVDYSAPRERNRFIFENCAAKAVITDTPRAASLEGVAPLLVYPGEATAGVGADWLNDQNPRWANTDKPGLNDLAYILYTSGSTGVPKGVMHNHSSAVSFVEWCEKVYSPTGLDRFSSHAPFHFDLSVLDLYVPATAGARVVVIGDELGKDPHNLASFIADSRITAWYSVPSILTLLLQFGKVEEKDYSALRVVNFAGEVFAIKHLRDLVNLWPGKGFYNLYGPTETNVCTYYKVPGPIPPEQTVPIPIGKVCENCRAAIWDEGFNPVTTGNEGVLYIHYSGPTMRGYWGDEARTAASSRVDDRGERWYCTGDVVVPREDGNLIFVGRRDRMVKRRGYRIELGEIEAGLHKHEDIREAAVVATDTPQGVVITAFVSPEEGKKLSIIALKQFCSKALLAYMSPDKFVTLDKLPRTSTDKLDYQSLKRLAQ